MRLPDVFRKLEAAVYTLACEDKPLQDRLDRAISELTPLTEKDMIPDFRADFKRLIAKIDAYRESGSRLDLRADIAQTIVELFLKYASFTGMWSSPE